MREQLKAKANDLPILPGVYLMKDIEGSIIYVGKSKHLKFRVSSYFGQSKNLPRKVQQKIYSLRLHKDTKSFGKS